MKMINLWMHFVFTCKWRIILIFLIFTYVHVGWAFNMYMYTFFCINFRFGIVLRQRGENQTAAFMLIESIKKYEFNWSAWKELSTLVVNKKMVSHYI